MLASRALPLGSVLQVLALPWIRRKSEHDLAIAASAAFFNVVVPASLRLRVSEEAFQMSGGTRPFLLMRCFEEASGEDSLGFQREEMLRQSRSSFASLHQVLPHSS